MRRTLVLTVRNWHVLQQSPSSGAPSSARGLAGCSGSSTAFGSTLSYCANLWTISFLTAAHVACCSDRCLLRLTTPVRWYLHTNTRNSGKKQKTLSQLSTVTFCAILSVDRVLLLLSACCGVVARLSQLDQLDTDGSIVAPTPKTPSVLLTLTLVCLNNVN